MQLSLKNKWFASLMVILTVVSFNHILAAPKTFVKDESGRVLIYRKEPKDLLCFTAVSSVSGLGFSYISLTSKGSVKELCGLYGIMFTGMSTLLLWNIYHTYDLLYKPLIIIDKRGITYEGKKKILWEKVCCSSCDKILGVEWLTIISLNANNTGIEYLKTNEGEIAISVKELQKFIEEAHTEYKNSVREAEYVNWLREKENKLQYKK